MPKKVFSFVYALNYIMQTALCLLTPAALFIGGGWYLTDRCGVGRWAMVVAIVLGVLTGLYRMFHFLITTAKYVDPTEQKGAQGNERDR